MEQAPRFTRFFRFSAHRNIFMHIKDGIEQKISITLPIDLLVGHEQVEQLQGATEYLFDDRPVRLDL